MLERMHDPTKYRFFGAHSNNEESPPVFPRPNAKGINSTAPQGIISALSDDTFHNYIGRNAKILGHRAALTGNLRCRPRILGCLRCSSFCRPCCGSYTFVQHKQQQIQQERQRFSQRLSLLPTAILQSEKLPGGRRRVSSRRKSGTAP